MRSAPVSAPAALALALASGACVAPQEGGGVLGTWEPMTTAGAPAPRSGHIALWNGREMIVWGGTNDDGTRFNDGGRYDPALDVWTPMSTTGAPLGHVGHRAVVTADGRVLVWGGFADNDVAVASGGLYDPDTDTWTPLSTLAAPAARAAHLSVWTGSELIVWGGTDGSDVWMTTGGRYDPATDTWRAMPSAGVPTPSSGFTAVWTGSQMIVWGMTGPAQAIPAGARYQPGSDTWLPMGQDGAPAIPFHVALWTGGEMIVWGSSIEGIGARYNPVSNLWSVTTRFPEAGGEIARAAVWAESELIVWGGNRADGSTLTFLNTGTRYEPSFLSAAPTASAGAPAARAAHTAVWTGSEMVVWGGRVSEGPTTAPTNTGGRYTPP